MRRCEDCEVINDSVKNTKAELFLCLECTKKRWPQDFAATEIRPNNNAANSNNNGSTPTTIFEKLLAASEQNSFISIFCSNLERVYEYAKADIIEFLTGKDISNVAQRDKLLALRLQVYEKLCEVFPEYASTEMFNRRKHQAIAEDIYILGYSVTNAMKDKRLSKVLKVNDEIPSSQPDLTDNSENANLIQTSDWLETCISLRDSVTNLTGVVKSLTTEVSTLREKIALLETRISRQSATSHNNTEQQILTEPVETEPKTVTIEDGSSELADESSAESDHDGHSGVTQEEAEEDSDEDLTNFRLSSHQRRKIRKGNIKVVASQRNATEGKSNGTFRIQAANKGRQGIKAIYIGNMQQSTTDRNIRQHLRDIGVLNVSDVIKLSRREAKTVSFCVSVDTQQDEDRIYNSDNWPRGIQIRPFREKITRQNSGSKTQGYKSQGDHRYWQPRNPAPRHNNYTKHHSYSRNHSNDNNYRTKYSYNGSSQSYHQGWY
jgi:hypothetical protein